MRANGYNTYRRISQTCCIRNGCAIVRVTCSWQCLLQGGLPSIMYRLHSKDNYTDLRTAQARWLSECRHANRGPELCVSVSSGIDGLGRFLSNLREVFSTPTLSRRQQWLIYAITTEVLLPEAYYFRGV